MINNLKRANRGTKKTIFLNEIAFVAKPSRILFYFRRWLHPKKSALALQRWIKKANRTNINVDLMPTVCIFFYKK